MREFDLIVSRHPGAVEWLASHLFPAEHSAYCTATGLVWRYFGVEPGDDLWDDAEQAPRCYREIPVRAEVSADDVRGKHVVGNLPLHLVALAATVTAIEFAGAPPRGLEYTAADMISAGSRLVRYVVRLDRSPGR